MRTLAAAVFCSRYITFPLQKESMAANLPYLPSPGSLKTVFEKIRSAATPDRVTKDFVSTVVQLKGGTGATIPPFLKKIGFVASDGAPTDLYSRFRNSSSAGGAVADGIRIGYKDLTQVNEYFHLLSDKDLLSLIVQVTGAEADGQVPKLTLQTLKALKAHAKFDADPEAEESSKVRDEPPAAMKIIPSSSQTPHRKGVGLNLAYTINLNLPATADQAVFNAIFRSLKEHLLASDD